MMLLLQWNWLTKIDWLILVLRLCFYLGTSILTVTGFITNRGIRHEVFWFCCIFQCIQCFNVFVVLGRIAIQNKHTPLMVKLDFWEISAWVPRLYLGLGMDSSRTMERRQFRWHRSQFYSILMQLAVKTNIYWALVKASSASFLAILFVKMGLSPTQLKRHVLWFRVCYPNHQRWKLEWKLVRSPSFDSFLFVIVIVIKICYSATSDMNPQKRSLLLH